MRTRASRTTIWMLAFGAAITLFQDNASAVPSMGRQTGLQCATCHTIFPELTPYGRDFKLRAFSPSVKEKTGDSMFGDVPISMIAQFSRTATRNVSTEGATPEDFPRDRQTILQAAGVYYGGRITDNSGALVQYFYDGIEKEVKVEMFDLRWANSVSTGGRETIFGLTLSNNPTTTDIYNSTPQWGFPHSETAALMPNAAAMIDMTLAGKVGGPGAYVMWNEILYGEVAVYRNNRNGILRPLGWGNERDPLVQGNAPYWRLALQREMDAHNFSVGTYGLVARTHVDAEDASTPANRYRDTAFDAQYQYITHAHQFSVQSTWIREKQELGSSFESGLASSPDATLKTFRVNAHYSLQRRYGAGLQYFRTQGTADDLRYNTGAPLTGSMNGSPNTRGWTGQLSYLPVQNVKLELRYIAYKEFNGAAENYDGFGRNASDNNSLYLLAWLMF